MKASELNLTKDGYNFSCNICPAGGHYKMAMLMGNIFPTTKAQAKHFVGKRHHMDVLNYEDVQLIESLLNKHGFEGNYKYTKSKTWVRLINTTDLHDALKKEYAK